MINHNDAIDYIASNKAAWEEAFNKRDPDWGKDIIDRIRNEDYPFFENEMALTLKKYNVMNKSIAQFCCNNGRELISIM